MKNNREQIINVASYLISDKGYVETSIQEIADIVGMHKSTIFHYFKSKEEILLGILELSGYTATSNLKKSMLDNKEKDPVERLKIAINVHINTLTQFLNNVKVYLREVNSLSEENKIRYLRYRKKYEEDMQSIVKDIQASTKVFDGLNPKMVTYAILGMCNWLAIWYRRDGPFDPDFIADTFFKMMVPENLTHC